MAKPMSSGQKVALALAHALSFVSLGLVLYWIYGNSDSSYFLGGTALTGTKLFNVHPLMMVAGLVVAFTQSLLSWRTYPFTREVTKALHGFWAFVAVVLTSIGLWAVFQYHNDQLYANLYTAHSWVGIAVVTMFYAQYVGGFLSYGVGLGSQEAKKAYMPRHVFLGIFTYIGAAFTCMLGIQDKNSGLGCGYNFTLTEPDYNPAEHYDNLYEGCRVSNGLCIAIFATCLAASYAVMNTGAVEPPPTEKNAPLLASAGTA